MAMVVRANRDKALQATYRHSLYPQRCEIGYNHFFRARTDHHSGDQVYFQAMHHQECAHAPLSKDV